MDGQEEISVEGQAEAESQAAEAAADASARTAAEAIEAAEPTAPPWTPPVKEEYERLQQEHRALRDFYAEFAPYAPKIRERGASLFDPPKPQVATPQTREQFEDMLEDPEFWEKAIKRPAHFRKFLASELERHTQGRLGEASKFREEAEKRHEAHEREIQALRARLDESEVRFLPNPDYQTLAERANQIMQEVQRSGGVIDPRTAFGFAKREHERQAQARAQTGAKPAASGGAGAAPARPQPRQEKTLGDARGQKAPEPNARKKFGDDKGRWSSSDWDAAADHFIAKHGLTFG